jgi:hypothetical protein
MVVHPQTVTSLEDELAKIAEFKMRHLALLGALATGTGIGEGHLSAEAKGHRNVPAYVSAKVQGKPFDGKALNEARDSTKRTFRIPKVEHADTPKVVSNVSKMASVKGELKEIEKAALDPISTGLVMHVAANSGYKFLRSRKAGHRLEAGQVATGYRHALGNRNIHPVARNVATFGLGPESLVNYDLGQELGNSLKGMSKGKRYRQLKKLRKNVAMAPHTREAPMGRSVVPAVNRILSGQQGVMDKVKHVPANAPVTMAQKALSLGLGGAAIAAQPDTAIHMGINATRKMIGNSDQGKRFFRDQFAQGLDAGPISKAKELASDFLISPAALDTRRLGAAMSKDTVDNKPLARRLGTSVLGQFRETPRGSAMLGRARGASQIPSADMQGKFIDYISDPNNRGVVIPGLNIADKVVGQNPVTPVLRGMVPKSPLQRILERFKR